MGRKHLHELLQQDQEPFQLKNFIADRRSQLKSTATDAGKTALRLRKRNPIIESTSSSTTARNLCINHVCLFSFQDSPDIRKSPFLDFTSRERKSPCNNASDVFLHIPSRTAAMLLDAATRVQKPKPGSKHVGFGLLGSFLRRLKDRSTRTKSREIGPVNATPSSPPRRRSRRKTVNGGVEVDNGGDEKRLSNSCNNSRLSSGMWSEKLSELETSCSSRSIHESEEIECLCSNPSSPFRFSLHRTPSPTRRKPESSSPVTSPSRHFQQDNNKSYEGEHPQEIHDEKDDNEKEQCSPISVLDPLFDEDDEEHDDGEKDSYDIECSYANVERAKQQLLQKLQRFERLAGLDPVELEKHMLEQHCDDDDDDDDDDDNYDDENYIKDEEITNEEFVKEIFNHLGVGKIPWYMKKLVFDLISEENRNEEHGVVIQKVCKRLHSWKVVELSTIDMMVENDFGSEGWKRYNEEKSSREIEFDIEEAIFEFLVEELAQELVKSS